MNKISTFLVVTVLHSMSARIIEIPVSRNEYSNIDRYKRHKNYRKYLSDGDSSEDSMETVSSKSVRQVDPVFARVLAGLRDSNNKVKDSERLLEYLELKSMNLPKRSRKHNINNIRYHDGEGVGFPVISQHQKNRIGDSLFYLGPNYEVRTTTFPTKDKEKNDPKYESDQSNLEALGLRDKVIINSGGRNFQKSRPSDSPQQPEPLSDPEDLGKSSILPSEHNVIIDYTRFAKPRESSDRPYENDDSDKSIRNSANNDKDQPIVLLSNYRRNYVEEADDGISLGRSSKYRQDNEQGRDDEIKAKKTAEKAYNNLVGLVKNFTSFLWSTFPNVNKDPELNQFGKDLFNEINIYKSSENLTENKTDKPFINKTFIENTIENLMDKLNIGFGLRSSNSSPKQDVPKDSLYIFTSKNPRNVIKVIRNLIRQQRIAKLSCKREKLAYKLANEIRRNEYRLTKLLYYDLRDDEIDKTYETFEPEEMSSKPLEKFNHLNPKRKTRYNELAYEKLGNIGIVKDSTVPTIHRRNNDNWVSKLFNSVSDTDAKQKLESSAGKENWLSGLATIFNTIKVSSDSVQKDWLSQIMEDLIKSKNQNAAHYNSEPVGWFSEITKTFLKDKKLNPDNKDTSHWLEELTKNVFNTIDSSKNTWNQEQVLLGNSQESSHKSSPSNPLEFLQTLISNNNMLSKATGPRYSKRPSTESNPWETGHDPVQYSYNDKAIMDILKASKQGKLPRDDNTNVNAQEAINPTWKQIGDSKYSVKRTGMAAKRAAKKAAKSRALDKIRRIKYMKFLKRSSASKGGEPFSSFESIEPLSSDSDDMPERRFLAVSPTPKSANLKLRRKLSAAKAPIENFNNFGISELTTWNNRRRSSAGNWVFQYINMLFNNTIPKSENNVPLSPWHSNWFADFARGVLNIPKQDAKNSTPKSFSHQKSKPAQTDWLFDFAESLYNTSNFTNRFRNTSEKVLRMLNRGKQDWVSESPNGIFDGPKKTRNPLEMGIAKIINQWNDIEGLIMKIIMNKMTQRQLSEMAALDNYNHVKRELEHKMPANKMLFGYLSNLGIRGDTSALRGGRRSNDEEPANSAEALSNHGEDFYNSGEGLTLGFKDMPNIAADLAYQFNPVPKQFSLPNSAESLSYKYLIGSALQAAEQRHKSKPALRTENTIDLRQISNLPWISGRKKKAENKIAERAERLALKNEKVERKTDELDHYKSELRNSVLSDSNQYLKQKMENVMNSRSTGESRRAANSEEASDSLTKGLSNKSGNTLVRFKNSGFRKRNNDDYFLDNGQPTKLMEPTRRLWKVNKAQEMERALTNSKTNTMIGDEPSRVKSRKSKIDPVMSALLDYRIQDGNLDEYARLIQAKEQLNNRRAFQDNNDASEDQFDSEESDDVALKEPSRRYDNFENCEQSSPESEAEEHNPGNPYTIYGNKYRQNWLWNHKMDGNHMNINPYGPIFDPLGPTGAELFFGRKWWYFNQDDYRPFRRR